MRLSNFKLERTEGINAIDWKYFASVDVETGILFWKKKERKLICRQYGGFYFFVDTGKYTPNRDAEELARAFTATTGQPA